MVTLVLQTGLCVHLTLKCGWEQDSVPRVHLIPAPPACAGFQLHNWESFVSVVLWKGVSSAQAPQLLHQLPESIQAPPSLPPFAG